MEGASMSPLTETRTREVFTEAPTEEQRRFVAEFLCRCRRGRRTGDAQSDWYAAEELFKQDWVKKRLGAGYGLEPILWENEFRKRLLESSLPERKYLAVEAEVNPTA